jgi:hypothetical protein
MSARKPPSVPRTRAAAPVGTPVDAAGAPPLPPMRGPLPSDEGIMSDQAKMSLVKIAQALRDEQLEARIVHYRADLETNSELDAITAQVVRELRDLQNAANAQREATEPPIADIAAHRAALESELIETMSSMMTRLFREGRLAPLLERDLAEVSKRFARTFFRSELHEKLRGTTGEAKAMRFPEQALYHLFARNEAVLAADLERLPYASADVEARARELFANMVKGLRDDFLSRTTPELNELMTMLHEVLREFLTIALPHEIPALTVAVVRNARLADNPRRAGYKVVASAFPTFRRVFETQLLERLVPYVTDRMLGRVRERSGKFRIETLHFVADPQIFSDVCEVLCDSVYESLYNDGFLDLPGDWRAKMALAR